MFAVMEPANLHQYPTISGVGGWWGGGGTLEKVFMRDLQGGADPRVQAAKQRQVSSCWLLERLVPVMFPL